MGLAPPRFVLPSAVPCRACCPAQKDDEADEGELLPFSSSQGVARSNMVKAAKKATKEVEIQVQIPEKKIQAAEGKKEGRSGESTCPCSVSAFVFGLWRLCSVDTTWRNFVASTPCSRLDAVFMPSLPLPSLFRLSHPLRVFLRPGKGSQESQRAQ